LNRISDGIFSLLLSKKVKPILRYQKTSELAPKITEKIYVI